MKYIGYILLFTGANYLYSWLNLGSAHWLQPFLLALIFLYLTEANPWIVYAFALIAGMTIDAFSTNFGLHTLSYILTVVLLYNLQIFVFTSKNIGTVFLLALSGWLSFWTLFWLLSVAIPWYATNWQQESFWGILKLSIPALIIVLTLYILYYNVFLKNRGRVA